MYGRIARITTAQGKRDDLIAILLGGASSLPGCLSYIVAQDATNSDALWVTKVWDNQAGHKAALLLPSVKAAISRAKPLISGFDMPIATVPVGGYGLHAAAYQSAQGP